MKKLNACLVIIIIITITITGWWLQTCFIFHFMYGNYDLHFTITISLMTIFILLIVNSY